MIHAYVGGARGAAALDSREEGASLAHASGGTRSASQRVWLSAHAERSARGGRLGTPPLPFAQIELAAQGAGLVVTRGGFGGRPVYTRALRDGALASTDLGWLARASLALGEGTELDADALAARSAHLPLGGSRSIYREIAEVPPATRVELSAEGATTSRRLAPPRTSLGFATAEELRERLVRTVLRACGTAPRLGVLTGGGLDSGALLALVARAGRPVNAFAIDFDGAFSDRPHLAALARELRLEPIRVAPEAAGVRLGSSAAGLPLTWASGAAESALLSRASEWGATRVLSGAFADACFDGDAEAASRVLPRAGLARAIEFGRAYDAAPFSTGVRRALWPWARAATPLRVRAALRRVRRVGRPPRARPFDGPRLARAREEAWSRSQERDARIAESPEERVARAFSTEDLALLAELRAQEEALSGVLRVDPYLDEELATFALSLLPDVLLAAGERRGLFREALCGLVPESLRTRPDKASFATLHAALFGAELGPASAPFGSFAALADLGIVEPRAAARGLARALHEPGYAAKNGAELFAFIAVEAWLVRGAR